MTTPDLMTTRELAALLRIKERKIYDLAAQGEVPCVRVTGKLLFPRPLIEAWLMRHTQVPGGAAALKPLPPVLAGSHDPLLEWAVREAETGLALLLDGSLDGLARLAKGEAMAAGVHLPEDGPEGWNKRHVGQALSGSEIVLIEWARRQQGMIVPAGNPKGLGGAGDLAGLRVVPRQREAGSFLLLERVLEEAGLGLQDVTVVDPPARSESEVAVAIREGRADAGIGLEAMAAAAGLGFVPLVTERFDLCVWRRAYFEAPLQRLFDFARSGRFAARAAALAGYDIARSGTVHYNAP